MRNEGEDLSGTFNFGFGSPSKPTSDGAESQPSDCSVSVSQDIMVIVNILSDKVISDEYKRRKTLGLNIRRVAVAGSLLLLVPLGYVAYSMSSGNHDRPGGASGPGGAALIERQSKDSPAPKEAEVLAATLVTLNREAHEHYNTAQHLRSQYLSSKEEKDLEDALKEFRLAVSKNPEYAEAHFNIGQILQSKNKEYWDEAIVEYYRAIKYRPEYVEAYFNIGQILRQKGDLDGATSKFKRVLELKPGHKKAEKNLSEIELIRK